MYEIEHLHADEDDGTMVDNVDTLSQAVVGHRIVSVERKTINRKYNYFASNEALVITLDNGKQVALSDTGDCCAFTEVQAFLLNPDKVRHIITGVGTTEGYTKWHIYADYGDILQLTIGWSAGNPFYYGYGLEIDVIDIPQE